LVLIDGRSVYTLTTGGVDWDQQDVPLEDIERIEVIRGPGGAIRGANAVNGVINILTKSAKATQGGLLSAGAGSQKTAQGLAQYGGTIGQKGSYRVFGNYSNFGNSASPAGETVVDGWRKSHAGFRTDWDLSPRDSMTVQGDLFQAREASTIDTLFSNDLPRQAIINDTITVGAGNVLGRWNHTLANGSDTSLQVYFDRYDRLEAGSRDTRDTFDVDFQHHLSVGSRHDVVWGLGYRATDDNITPGYDFRYVPAQRTDHLSSAFVQDELRISKSWWLTLGSKVEHNSYSGFAYEPNAKLVWTLSDRQTVWASASWAVRQLAQSDIGLQDDQSTFPLPNGGFGVVGLRANPNRQPERSRDFEIGYRAQMSKRLSLDIVTFTSYYQGLPTQEPGEPFFTAEPPPAHLVLPLFADGNAHGQTYGVEGFANWSVSKRWKLSPGYSFIHMNVAGNPGSQDPNAGQIVNDTPRHKFQIRSFLNLTRRLDWDSSLSYVGPLAAGEGAPTPGYDRLDTRFGWRIGEFVELSIVGQNLLTPRYAEFRDEDGTLHSLVTRKVFGKITWHF
jgi:iron complex outermembrane receptor protein